MKVEMNEYIPEEVSEEESEEEFDFEEHASAAVDAYTPIRGRYESLATVARHILEAAFVDSAVSYHRIESRAKEIESFRRKTMKPSDSDPAAPKYEEPLVEITDLAGVRVITFFPKALELVEACVESNFVVLERTDKSEELEEEGKFGYKSIHYLVMMKPERLGLPEYRAFDGMILEIQARTILQHAWAEMEHDIQYKSVDVIPVSIRRRFVALSGMLEIADREFQAIQDEDEQLRVKARSDLEYGNLDKVEITPDALKSYLDARFGPDGRMSLFNYGWLARTLRHMGFRNFQQIDECIKGYDDDRISRAIHGTRWGKISRFEDVMLAGMGERFLEVHPWRNHDWYCATVADYLRSLKSAGVDIGSYSPMESAGTPSLETSTLR